MRSFKRTIPFLLLLIGIAFIWFIPSPDDHVAEWPEQLLIEEDEEHTKENPQKRKRARAEYFFRLLRDPATNAIPRNIRQRELRYARTLPQQRAGKFTAGPTFNWREAGPNNVGGRTRALGIDVTNSNVIIAGGVSGGIWKSTDGGQSWTLKSDPNGMLSVTSIAQDPRPGHTDTWYAVSGEYDGSTTYHGHGHEGSYYGTGVYKSTDNGESWQQLMVNTSDPELMDSRFDYLSRVVVSPTTGTVFIASNLTGILRSDDGGQSFHISMGGYHEHRWSDVAVASDGTLLAALSIGYQPQRPPGLYLSTDDGKTWTNITPTGYPSEPRRSVVAFAPSNPNVAYVLTNIEVKRNVAFYKLNLAKGTADDRSNNLPGFGGRIPGLNTQHNYNMALAVKPDDENFVLIGGVNLYRSRDGFATPADDKDENLIGGRNFKSHHADQHVLVFDPNDPNKLWSGHDGGLSMLPDVTATSIEWVDKNNGYNVTQFYTVEIADEAGDDRIMGGTQDNGTPFLYLKETESSAQSSISVGSGDGAYAYLGDTYAYVSTQNGEITRKDYYAWHRGDIPYDPWTEVQPKNASGQLFIHPYAVDPNAENVIYYPAGNVLWRNDSLFAIPDYQYGTTVGWTKLEQIAAPKNYDITALTVSKTPAHVLYFAASGGYGKAPKIYRLENATTAIDGEIDISIAGTPESAWVHDIAVNPHNADEILVVFSNYNVVGLYHSTDGGRTYRAVEGNLKGNSSAPGPSLRSATILSTGSGAIYFVGTSTGLYTTSTLNGASTRWTQVAPQLIGNAIVSAVVSRPSDGRVVAATHGRGVFVGDTDDIGTGKSPTAIAGLEQPSEFSLAQNYPNPFNPTTTIAFTLAEPSRVDLTIYDMQGRVVMKPLTGTPRAAGRHSVLVKAAGLPSGTYIYRLAAQASATGQTVFIDSQMMTLVK